MTKPTEGKTMMSKLISVPIYDCELILIRTVDLAEVSKAYNLNVDLSGSGAVTFTDGLEHRQVAVAFEQFHRSLIVHEVVHIVNEIFLYSNVQLDRTNDEPQAYLSQWVYEQIDEFLT